MSGNFSGIKPAQLAFDPEYWGDLTTAECTNPPYRHVSYSERSSAHERLAYYVPRIANGQVHGADVSPGVTFNPYERDAGAHASHFFHGAVLLVDTEGINPANDKKWIQAPEEPEHSDIMSVPAHKLLRRARLEIFPGVRTYPVAAESFMNESGSEFYTRYAGVMAIARSMGGGVVPISLVSVNVGTRGGQVVKTNATGIKDKLTAQTATVGDTYVTYDRGGNITSLRRIRSVKICATGTQQEVKSGVLARLTANQGV